MSKAEWLLWLQDLPDVVGSQWRNTAISCPLFLHLPPPLSRASLGAEFTCPAQVLLPQEATAFICQQFPFKAVSPGGSYFGTHNIGSALAFCCALGHRANVLGQSCIG